MVVELLLTCNHNWMQIVLVLINHAYFFYDNIVLIFSKFIYLFLLSSIQEKAEDDTEGVFPFTSKWLLYACIIINLQYIMYVKKLLKLIKINLI